MGPWQSMVCANMVILSSLVPDVALGESDDSGRSEIVEAVTTALGMSASNRPKYILQLQAERFHLEREFICRDPGERDLTLGPVLSDHVFRHALNLLVSNSNSELQALWRNRQREIADMMSVSVISYELGRISALKDYGYESCP